MNTLSLGDRDGNYEYWSGSELAGLGYPTTLTVGANPDDTAPELTDFSVSPRSVDTRAGARTVTVTARATDGRSGIASIVASASKPGTRHRSSTALTKVRGTASTYRGTLVVPCRQANGTWHVDSVRLTTPSATPPSRATPSSARPASGAPSGWSAAATHPASQPDVRTADRSVNPFDREPAHLSGSASEELTSRGAASRR